MGEGFEAGMRDVELRVMMEFDLQEVIGGNRGNGCSSYTT